MADDRWLNERGVAKLSQSEGGQKYLAELRQKYWKESLQPSDPRFKHVYGDKLERAAKDKERQEAKAKEMWAEVKEKRNWKNDRLSKKKTIIL